MTSMQDDDPASPRPPFHLLYLIDEMKALTDGGTERQLLQMIRLMRERGVQVQLCTLRETAWLTPEKAGCPVRSCMIGSVMSPIGIWRLLGLVWWMRAQRFDILQTFFVDANLIGPLLGRLAGIKVLLGSRRNLNYWMRAQHLFFQRLSNLLATRLVANCRAVQESTISIEKVPPAKVDVLYNGLDTEYFRQDAMMRSQRRQELGFRDEEVVIGMVAVLRPVKGCEVFIQAAALVAGRCAKARFVLIGGGPLEDELKSKSRAAGLADRLLFTGSVEDIKGVLTAVDIAVLSSESEGFSNSILEYLSMALPTVATNVGGNAEAIGVAGVVVPPGNPSQLADKLVELAGDQSRRRLLSQAARERAADFGLGKVGDALESYYRKLLGIA